MAREITLLEYEDAETLMREFESQREAAGKKALEAGVAGAEPAAELMDRATFEAVAARIHRGIAHIQDALWDLEVEQFRTLGGESLDDLGAQIEARDAIA